MKNGFDRFTTIHQLERQVARVFAAPSTSWMLSIAEYAADCEFGLPNYPLPTLLQRDA